MASPGPGLSGPSTASDVPVTFEDQQRINRFARLNARMEEIREELKGKSNVLQNMEEALNEIQVAELEADDEVPLKVRLMEGEVFVEFEPEAAGNWIEDKKRAVKAEEQGLKETVEEIKKEMSLLKVALYQKFGQDNINLESED